MEGTGVRGTCGGKVESEVEKQWSVEYRLESGVESALQSGVVSDAESEQEWSGNWSGLWSEGGVQSKVRLGLDSGVKRGAKTGRMGKVGRRRLEKKVQREVDTGVKLARFRDGFSRPLMRFVLFAGMYPRLVYLTPWYIKPG